MTVVVIVFAVVAMFAVFVFVLCRAAVEGDRQMMREALRDIRDRREEGQW